MTRVQLGKGSIESVAGDAARILSHSYGQIAAGFMSRMSNVDEQFNTLVRLIEVEVNNSGKVNDDQNRS